MSEKINTVAENEVVRVVSECGELGAWQKKDLSKLRKIVAFRIDVKAGTGTKTTWKASGYVVSFKLQGSDSFYLASSLMGALGMKCKQTFKTEADAAAFAMECKKTWGRPAKAKAEKKPSEKVQLKAKLDDANAVISALAAERGVTVDEMIAAAKAFYAAQNEAVAAAM